MLLRVEWRSAIRADGVQCVMTSGEQLMLPWPVDSLGFLEQVRVKLLHVVSVNVFFAQIATSYLHR